MGESWRDMALRLNSGQDWTQSWSQGKGKGKSNSWGSWGGWNHQQGKGQDKGKGKGPQGDQGKGKGKDKDAGPKGKGKGDKGKGKGKGQDWPCPEPRCKALNEGEAFLNRKNREECFNCGLPRCTAPAVAASGKSSKEEERAKLKAELARNGPTPAAKAGGGGAPAATAEAAGANQPDEAMVPAPTKEQQKRLAALGLPLPEMAAEDALYRGPAKKERALPARVVEDALAGAVSEATAQKRAAADYLRASLVQMKGALGGGSKSVLQAE